MSGGRGRGGAIVCAGLVRIFRSTGVEVVALQGLDLVVEPGELTALVGASGSGKSTLLGILSGLDVPTAGDASVAGQGLLTMTERDRVRYRRETVGFLFQQASHNLLPHLTPSENIQVPMLLAGRPARERPTRARELLQLLGILEVADRPMRALSGGQQQRVALAVALANQPAVLLADEPTGELDSRSSDEVFAAIRAVNEAEGVTVLVVTHAAAVSSQVRRTVAIRDGRTAAEVHRRTSIDEHGAETVVAEEYAVLDRAGRLQLPSEFTTSLAMRDLVRLDLEHDHIGVWPTGQAADGSGHDPLRAREPGHRAGDEGPAVDDAHEDGS